MRMLLVLTILLTFAGAAHPQPLPRNGNTLLAACNSAVRLMDTGIAPKDQMELGFCLGLLQGITMSSRLAAADSDKAPVMCLPADGIENGQAARVVVRYLQDHPERLHHEEFVLAVAALRNAFPCAGKSGAR